MLWQARRFLNCAKSMHISINAQHVRGNPHYTSSCYPYSQGTVVFATSWVRIPQQPRKNSDKPPFFMNIFKACNLRLPQDRNPEKASTKDAKNFICSNIPKDLSTLKFLFSRQGYRCTSAYITRFLSSLESNAKMALFFFVWTETNRGQMHCPQLYKLMVKILIKSNNFEKLIYEIMEENPNSNEAAVLLLAMCYGYLKCPGLALQELRLRKSKLSQNAYNNLLDFLVEGGFLAEALKICTDILEEGFYPNVFTLNSLLVGLLNQKNVEETATLLENVEIPGFVPSQTCSFLLTRELCNARQTCRAYCILSNILKKDTSRSTRFLNFCVDAFCRAGQPDKADILISESVAWGYVPNTVTYNSLIAGFCQSGRLQESYLILDRMRSSGCRPDVISYNTLISGYNRKTMLSHTLKLFQEMLKNGICPDVWTYNSLMHGFFMADKEEEANKVKEEMGRRDLVPCVKTLNTMLNGLCKFGKVTDALKIFRRLKECGCSPDIVTYNTLIDGLCKAQMLDDANEILKDVEEEGYVPNIVTYTTVMNCCFRSGKIEQGLALFSKMKRRSFAFDAFTYCTAISGFSKIGKFKEASSCIEHMLSSGIDTDLVTYNSIINAFFKAGEKEKVFQLLHEMKSKGLIGDVYTYTIIINGLCRIGDIDAAFQQFIVMIKIGCNPNLVTYNSLINGFFKAGKVDKAVYLFEKMQKKDCITYTCLFYWLCKSGRVVDAYYILRSCLFSNITVCYQACNVVLSELKSLGFTAEARKLKSAIQMTEILHQ